LTPVARYNPLLDVPAGALRSAVWLLADPLDEPVDVRVGLEGLDGVVLPLKLLVVEDNVYMPVAGRTEINRAVDLPPIERLLVALVLVARPGDEVVAGQLLHRASAQAARSAPRAAVSLAHLPILTPSLPASSERVLHSTPTAIPTRWSSRQ
jgi:hypothetical protein